MTHEDDFAVCRVVGGFCQVIEQLASGAPADVPTHSDFAVGHGVTLCFPHQKSGRPGKFADPAPGCLDLPDGFMAGPALQSKT